MTVILGDLEFDNVMYDGDADVLYLHVETPPPRRVRGVAGRPRPAL